MKQESSSVEKFILKVLQGMLDSDFCIAHQPGIVFGKNCSGFYEPFVAGFFSALKLDQFNQKYDR